MAPATTRYAFSLFWAPVSVLALVLIAGQLLTVRYRTLSGTAFVIVLTIAAALELYTYYEERHARFKRAMLATIVLVASVTVIEIQGVVHLIALLLGGGPAIHGPRLLVSGLYYWACNVLAFGLWYWLIDRGGPPKRAMNAPGPADFLFPEMTSEQLRGPGWQPGLAEYMYLAFTNATAFSPTDTLPLSSRARLLMTAESVISLIVLALVTARAVNILK